jgi:hypothetical protein
MLARDPSTDRVLEAIVALVVTIATTVYIIIIFQIHAVHICIGSILFNSCSPAVNSRVELAIAAYGAGRTRILVPVLLAVTHVLLLPQDLTH